MPEIAAFGGGRLPPRAAQKHARTCKKLPVASFCASETAETGRIANGREQGDHVGGDRAAKEFKFVCAKLFFGWADSRFGKPRSSFLEGFNFVRAKPPLRRAESRFAKPRIFFWEGFNFVRAKPPLRRADSRFAKPRIFPVRETDWYFLRRAKSTAKTRRGLRPSGLPGTIQSSVGEDFSKVFRRHEPKPVFRTKRRRKGFESVRRSGVTA